ncbi:hypothetical protein SDC9_101031 [bioreactor metagenome]|uniref:Pre-toxin TG domain-containing protein n=1 Tax=bioreactor metagenome TaxID=1076179 RepID=A0A645AMV3_9ZZZZ
MDIRDLTYDITNWEWTPEHIAQTLLDTVGFIPVIGSLKYADEFADVLKSADELADLVKRAPELVDAARAVGKLDDVLGSVDEFGELLESAPEVADLFKNTDEAVDLLGSADEIFKGARDVSIYRAVGPEEFYDIFENKQFRTTDTSLYAKQFGFDFDDTLKYANWSPDAAAIIEVKIPDSVLKDIGDFTPLDTPIFKHGTVTIHGDQLDIFNKYISDIFHVF